MSVLLTIRGAARYFNIYHHDVTLLLRRNGYKLPKVKRGQSILVSLEHVSNAIRKDRQRRTVQPKGKRR